MKSEVLIQYEILHKVLGMKIKEMKGKEKDAELTLQRENIRCLEGYIEAIDSETLLPSVQTGMRAQVPPVLPFLFSRSV